MLLLAACLSVLSAPKPDIDYPKLVARLMFADPIPKEDPHAQLLQAVKRAVENAVVDSDARPLSLYRFLNYHPGNLAPASIFVTGTNNVRPELLALSAHDPIHPDQASAGGGYDDLVPTAEEYYQGWLLPRSVPEYEQLKRFRSDRKAKSLPLVFRSSDDRLAGLVEVNTAIQRRASVVAALKPWDVLPISKPHDLKLLIEGDFCELSELRVIDITEPDVFLSAYQGMYLAVHGVSTTNLTIGKYSYFGLRAYFYFTHTGTVRMPDGRYRAVPHYKPINADGLRTALKTTPKPEHIRPAARFEDSFRPGYWQDVENARKRSEEDSVTSAFTPFSLSPFSTGRTQYVRSYTKRDGTYVKGYYRSPAKR